MRETLAVADRAELCPVFGDDVLAGMRLLLDAEGTLRAINAETPGGQPQHPAAARRQAHCSTGLGCMSST